MADGNDDEWTRMRSTSSTPDLFIAKKGRLARGIGRVRSSPHRTIHQGKAEAQARRDSEREYEQLELLIRSTIRHRSLETHFQPIVDLKSGGAVGTEALARFYHPHFETPDVWFAEAATVGLGVELELTAMDLALEQLPRLPSGLYLSLNASVETIVSDQFQSSLADSHAERVVLELTEHTEVDDYQMLEHSIQDLRSRGVRLAVDDAGAGFASFRHILNLQPDVIKLDIGLTRGIDRDPARRALGRALLAFGMDAYNATIVAEGIETENELNTLRSLGFSRGQGFLLGRPSRLPLQDAPTNTFPGLIAPEELAVAQLGAVAAQR